MLTIIFTHQKKVNSAHSSVLYLLTENTFNTKLVRQAQFTYELIKKGSAEIKINSSFLYIKPNLLFYQSNQMNTQIGKDMYLKSTVSDINPNYNPKRLRNPNIPIKAEISIITEVGSGTDVSSTAAEKLS